MTRDVPQKVKDTYGLLSSVAETLGVVPGHLGCLLISAQESSTAENCSSLVITWAGDESVLEEAVKQWLDRKKGGENA